MYGSRTAMLARWFWVAPIAVAGALALAALVTARSVTSETQAGNLAELEIFLDEIDDAAPADGQIDEVRLLFVALTARTAVEDRQMQLVESLGEERAEVFRVAVLAVTDAATRVARGDAELLELDRAKLGLIGEVARQQDEDLGVLNQMVSDLQALVLGLVVVLSLGGIVGAVGLRLSERTVARLRREEFQVRERLAARNSELAYSSSHDTLTGLLNRAAFFATASVQLADVRKAGRQMALLYADMDRFKVLNDLRGHQFADDVLVITARRMMEAVGHGAAVGRLGGDEFAVAFPVISVSALTAQLDALQARLVESIVLDGVRIEPSLSIGVSCFPRDGADVDFLTRHAELAMYEAKGSGGGRYELFSPRFAEAASAKHVLEVTLRDAIECNEITVEYQPIVRIDDGAIVAVEALARWTDPERGAVSPAEFIPIAEASGLIIPLGQRVIDIALGEVRGWLDSGWEIPVAVNLSPIQLRPPDFVAGLEEMLARHRVPATLLTFEIATRSRVAEDNAEIETLQRLRELGVSISIYDVGLARAFAGRLEELPADTLKIEGAVVSRIEKPEQAAVVEAALTLGRRLGLQVIAEGVESEAQLERLRAFGCRYGQGFFFHRPGAADTVRAALAAGGASSQQVA